MCPFTCGVPPFSPCSLQERRNHNRNVEFKCSNAQLTMQDSFNERIDCTGDQQGGLGDSCSCTNWSSHKGKQHLGFRTQNYAPTTTRNDHPMVVKKSLEPSVQKLHVPRKASSAQFSLLCLHKLIRNKGTIFALPDNSAVAKAGVWLPFLGPHGQGT